jgi:hypothetical protein
LNGIPKITPTSVGATSYSWIIALLIALLIQIVVGMDIFGRVQANEEQSYWKNDLNDFVFENKLHPQKQSEIKSMLEILFNKSNLLREALILYHVHLDVELSHCLRDEQTLEKLGHFTHRYKSVLQNCCATVSRGHLLPGKSCDMRQIAFSNPEEMLVWMSLKKRFLNQEVLAKN